MRSPKGTRTPLGRFALPCACPHSARLASLLLLSTYGFSYASSVLWGHRMRAWTVDADDIRVAEDFNESLLHHTPEIDGFLRSDRDAKFIVIGTKGFGKTLLLKVKRILYQREGRAACLPVGALLDKPIGDKIFSRELLAFFVVSPLPWSKIWLTAISLATLKHV